jgi:hypothetical protein
VIYFIQAGKNGPIKIGVAEELHKRVDELQIGCPYKLHVLYVYNGRQLSEPELHELFKHEHIRGEWFRPASAIAKFNKRFPQDCYPITNIGLYECRDSEYQIAMEKRYSL